MDPVVSFSPASPSYQPFPKMTAKSPLITARRLPRKKSLKKAKVYFKFIYFESINLINLSTGYCKEGRPGCRRRTRANYQSFAGFSAKTFEEEAAQVSDRERD